MQIDTLAVTLVTGRAGRGVAVGFPSSTVRPKLSYSVTGSANGGSLTTARKETRMVTYGGCHANDPDLEEYSY